MGSPMLHAQFQTDKKCLELEWRQQRIVASLLSDSMRNATFTERLSVFEHLNISQRNDDAALLSGTELCKQPSAQR
ncbi:hypothetical protein J6590_040693 [Homalodisca vitripennis]|nr:hypothetical protein J6590_040693 [Homalodisca vitripennis]